MPQFMVMVLENEAEARNLAPSETKALVEGHSTYERKLRAVLAYLDGERLRPSTEGRKVSIREGQPRIEAVPIAERAMSGFYVLEAENLDAAVRLAAECPMAPGGELEVRPLMKWFLHPNKTSHQGRVFAFAVLGTAPNEQGWIDVMDQIDDSTRDGFPAERFLGGVRLHAPGRGRRVAPAGGRQAIFDGPFLESKEVIGGLFFLRMASVEEAVDWAIRTDFVNHGAVEIRELWRS